MKKVILIALLAPVIVFAQKSNVNLIENGKYLGVMPVKDESIFYTEVVQLDSSATKDELYKRAKRFFFDTYKSGKEVIQLDDKENGEVDGKGNLLVLWKYSALAGPTSVRISEMVKIFVKDGRYKYEVSDFRISVQNQPDMQLETFLADRVDNKRKFIPVADHAVLSLIDALKAEMNKKATPDF